MQVIQYFENVLKKIWKKKKRKAWNWKKILKKEKKSKKI